MQEAFGEARPRSQLCFLGMGQRRGAPNAPSSKHHLLIGMLNGRMSTSCCYVSSRKRLSGLPANALLDQIEHQIAAISSIQSEGILIRVILRVYIAPVVRTHAYSSSRPRPEVA